MIMKLLIAVTVGVMGTTAFAHGDGDGHDEPTPTHGFSLLEVNAAMLTSLEDLKDSEPATAEKVYAFQGRIAEEDAKIRFYVQAGEGETVKVNYLCHKHDGEAECHRQGDN